MVLWQEIVNKRLFLASVKLHCQTSESKFANNLLCNGWMSVYSDVLGPSALKLFSPKNSWSSFECFLIILLKINSFSGIIMKKQFLGIKTILVIRKILILFLNNVLICLTNILILKNGNQSWKIEEKTIKITMLEKLCIVNFVKFY